MAKPKPATERTQLPFRADPTLAARLRVFAETEGMNLNAAIVALLDRALKVRGL